MTPLFQVLLAAAAVAPTISAASEYLTVTYDVATETERILDIAPPAIVADAATIVPDPNEGSRAGRNSRNIPRGVMRELAQAAPAYAPYVSDRPSEDDDRFSEYGIVDRDDRKVVIQTKDFPASAIANILFRDATGERKLCSGAMIAEDALLTAGHCVFITSWHWDYTVIVGRNVGREEFEQCGVERIYIPAIWKEILPGHDLALLKLDCSVGVQSGYFPIRAFAEEDIGEKTRLQGYPGQIDARGRQYYAEDEVTDAKELLIDHRIDTSGGMSGSPMWRETDSAIFAVHTHATKAPDWSEINLKAFVNHATRLTPGRIAMLQTWLEDMGHSERSAISDSPN